MLSCKVNKKREPSFNRSSHSLWATRIVYIKNSLELFLLCSPPYHTILISSCNSFFERHNGEEKTRNTVFLFEVFSCRRNLNLFWNAQTRMRDRFSRFFIPAARSRARNQRDRMHGPPFPLVVVKPLVEALFLHVLRLLYLCYHSNQQVCRLCNSTLLVRHDWNACCP